MILDASVALSWFFKDEQTPATRSVLQQATNSGAVVPGHWHLEVANSLRFAERKGRIASALVGESLDDLSNMAIEIDPETSALAWTATLALARTHNLTLYDAAYLELALRRDLPLATLDAKLRAAAQTLGRPLLGI